MIFGVLILVVIVVGVGVALMMKGKGGSGDDGMMSVPTTAEAQPPSQTLSERLEQHTNVTAVPRSPQEAVEPPAPAPAPAEPREPSAFEAAPDLTAGRTDRVLAEPTAPSAGGERGTSDDSRTAEDAKPAVDAAADDRAAPVVPEPVAPEPMVKARVQPTPTTQAAPVRSTDASDDADDAVPRLRVPGQRPVKAADAARRATTDATPQPAASERTGAGPTGGASASPSSASPSGDGAADAAGDDTPSLLPSFLAPPTPAEVAAPEDAAPDGAAAREETAAAPTASDSGPAGADEPIGVFDVPGDGGAPADDAPAATDDEGAPAEVGPDDLPRDDVFASLYEAQINGDLGLADDDETIAADATREPAATQDVPEVEDDVAAVASLPETEEASPESIEPEVSAGTTPPPVQFVLEPEPEADPVDHILKALVNRAKARQVGIAEVAAELVEQANLEDRDIDEVLADLVERVDEDDEQVDPAARLEELTFFNESVPRRPGQITDYDRLDKAAKKKVIIRVLCLLVAMQEDNRLKPSDPRSEAETRHWPLARAVWPVPVGSTAEAEAAAEESAGDEGGDDKKLPGRRLLRTTKR